MPEDNDSIKERFRSRLDSPGSSAVTVRYRIQGGAPGERLDEEVVVRANDGAVEVRVSDELGQQPQGEATEQLDDDEVTELLRHVEESLDDLVPRSEAEFLPDSDVGMITISVNDEEETYYFDTTPTALEDGPATGEAAPASAVRRLVERMSRLERSALEVGGDVS